MLFLTILFQTPIDDPNQFNGFLILGYGVTWLIGMSYLLYIYNDRRNVEKDIELMQRLLEDDED